MLRFLFVWSGVIHGQRTHFPPRFIAAAQRAGGNSVVTAENASEWDAFSPMSLGKFSCRSPSNPAPLLPDSEIVIINQKTTACQPEERTAYKKNPH